MAAVSIPSPRAARWRMRPVTVIASNPAVAAASTVCENEKRTVEPAHRTCGCGSRT